MISVTKVESRADWKAFLRFPWHVYRDYPAWIPPIVSEQKKQLRPETGTFFNDGYGSKAEYFIAQRDGETVGRIAAIANERHRQTHNDGVGFVGFFESIDDQDVARSLFEKAETWLSENNFFLSRGPTSFTIYDPAGVTVLGNDLRPGVGMAYTPPYYAELFESCGYRKARDLFAYRFSSDCADPVLLNSKIAAFGQKAAEEIDIRSLKPHDQSDAEIIATIFNRSWEENWGAIPMTADDFLHIQKEMGPFADERLVYLASKDGNPIAFFVASLDPGGVLQKMNGRVGPKGLYEMIFERHLITHARVILMGVLPEHRNSPAVIRLLLEFYRHWKEFPSVESLEFSWILEDNMSTRKLVESIGGKHSHTFRVYEKFM